MRSDEAMMRRATALFWIGWGVGGVACRPAPPAPGSQREGLAHAPATDVAPPPPAADAGLAGLEAEATSLLPIPARAQAAESPPSGWCGETAIQEGLLYLGVWAPQRVVNRAGQPAHADLYATEIPHALHALGAPFTPYGRGPGYEAFARWAREAIDGGDPVLAGVKLIPSEHPTWGLDHFVLLVGYGPRGFLANTTWGGRRAWVSDASPELSLKGAFYGLRLRGAGGAARLSVLEEKESRVTLAATCPGGGRVEWREQPGHGPVRSVDAGASVTLAADRAAWFTCAR